ncbi:autotransporter-associated beta strand repeat-containing protein [Polynucleobacter sp. MWH-Spelu-300-X4]|uniref:autotransporter-associated beta strand repeat-containing protein n=1 Tax=Polynucleobacter sp. MWH-Spelu-300-X4 TaxID=2689109 RepID=UPI00203B064E|nr:autotransporter-associated beta strand repeat-containing protein [Polynucleobacter sp. MWH-Spelu-300-X4]
MPAFAQNVTSATLPTGGQVVAGSANITKNGNTLNVVQSSQRAVVNWSSYNVGAQAKVVYQQPDANSVTLNRVTGVSASQIDGAVQANGTVIFANTNGVTFGKTAQVDAGAVVATTMNQSNEEFMAGKTTYTAKGGVNAQGKVTNRGQIKANDYVALMAPEVRNEGVITAQGGTGNGAVALASGSVVTLNFNGNQFVSVKVDASVYKSLIVNRRLIEAPGGAVFIAANSAAQLMASVIKNSGRVSTTSMVSNGGRIEIIAGTVKNAGVFEANANGASGNGGQIAVNGDVIKLGASSNIQANAKTAGNGGKIVVMSNKSTTVAGSLSAQGGSSVGNGGLIETSSHESLAIAPNVKVSTVAPAGKAGTWLLDPNDLTIDAASAAVISLALQNSNVTVQVVGNVCSGGTCTQNGSGNLTIASGVEILKSGATPTTLSLFADGTFFNYGSINAAPGSLLNVLVNSSAVTLAAGSNIAANQVTVIAQGPVNIFGSITGIGSNPLVNILAGVFNLYGAIAVDLTIGNGGRVVVTSNKVTLSSGSRIEANGLTDGGEVTVTSNLTGEINSQGYVQANGGTGRGGTITFTDTQTIFIQNATLQANGNDGGQITLSSYSGDINIQNSLIQTNGSTGRGGSIGISGANSTTLVASTINAQGWSQGGTILIGNDAKNGTLPFSLSANLDAQTTISSNQLDIANAINGGFIETSGHTLNLLASINAGRGGMWLIDPNDITIDSTFAGTIVTALASSNVIVSTTSTACSGVSCGGSAGSGNISITGNITTNTNYDLSILASGAISVSGGVKIWLNTSNNSTYTKSTGTGSLYMGGQDVATITSSNWNSACSNCYALANTATTAANYAAINLGTSGAGSSAVDVRVGGDVVMAGKNTTGSGGYAGITMYSGSIVYGRNISLFGISSAGVGMQLSWGSSATIDLRATSATGKLLLAGESSYVDAGATGTNALGVFVNGSVLRAPTLEIIGRNTNASCTSNIACAGISLGWYTTSAQTTNIYTNYLKLTSDKVVLGLSPVAVALCDSGCASAGSNFGIDFSSYASSSAMTFYYPSTSSNAMAVLGNNYGNYLVLPAAGTTLNAYKYSQNADIVLSSSISVAGPISLTGTNIYLNDASLTSTASGASILLKATGSITVGLGSTTTLKTNNGNITLWADSDGNNDGYIRVRENVTFNSANGLTNQSTGGGAITLAGGSATDSLTGLPNGYAYSPSGNTATWGSTAAAGVQLAAYTTVANSIAFYSGGGNVVIKGKSANGMPGIAWISGNSSGATQIIDAGAGTITVDGQAVGTGHGIEFTYGGGGASPTLKSASSATVAISVTGATTSTGAYAGYQGIATFIASGTGGISLSGATSATAYRSIQANPINLYAASGDITITGTGGTGINIDGTWGKGTLASSSSNITVTAASITLNSTTTSTSGNIKFDGALTVTADETFTTTAGIVTFTGAINSDSSTTPRALVVNAGTGSIIFNGAIGGIYPIASLVASASGGITINGSITTATGFSDGLLFEKFDGYVGNNLTAFTTAQNVQASEVSGAPGNTTSVVSTTIDVCPSGSCDDTYSYRITGYFVPKVSGVYTFQINGDDSNAIFMGAANQTIAQLKKQVEVNPISSSTPGFLASWNGTNCCVNNTGNTPSLTAGQAYPIYAMFSENAGGDNLKVAFKLSGDSNWISANSRDASNGVGYYFNGVPNAGVNLTGPVTINNATITAPNGRVQVNGAVTANQINVSAKNVMFSGASTVSSAGGVTISATSDIVLNSALAYTGTGAGTFSFTAGDSIFVNNTITSTGGPLALQFNADASTGYIGIENSLTTRGGAISFTAATISLQQNAFTIDTSLSGSTGGSVTFNGNLILAKDSGDITINTGGGTVTFNGSVDSASSYLRQSDLFDDLVSTTDGWTLGTNGTYSAGSWGTILGLFGSGGTVNRAINLGGAARTIAFEFYRVDSWDSEYFYVQIGGNDVFTGRFVCCTGVLATEMLTAASQTTNGYTTLIQPIGAGLVNVTGNAGWDDQKYKISITTPSALTSLNVALRSNLDSAYTDEAWGIKNFTVSGAATTYMGNASGLNINAGTGNVNFNNAVGGNKATGNITVNGAAVNASNINIYNGGTLSVTNTAASSISGVISGGMTLTKAGAGTLTLTGNSTYTGLTTVNAGTLKFAPSSGFAMALSGGITNNSDVLYDATSASVLFLDGAVSGAGTWTVNSATSNTTFNNRMIFRGTATTSGQVTVTNYGNFWLEGASINTTSPIYLNGANTYLRVYGSAGATIKAGTITGNGTVDFTSGGGGKALTLSVGNDNGTGTFSGVIANSSADNGPTVLSIAKAGTGTWTPSGTNTYTGSTTITGGTLVIAADANLGTAPTSATVSSLVLNGGTLSATADITLNTNRGISLGANGGTFNVASAKTLTYGGIMADISGAVGGLTKTGAGTLTLSGSSTYSGATNVNAGTLKLTSTGVIYNSTSIAGSASAITTVASGAVLELTSWGWAGTGGLGQRYFDASALVINGGTLRYSGTTNTVDSSATRGLTVGVNGAIFDSVTSGVTWTMSDGSATPSYKSIFNGSVTFMGAGNIGFAHVITGSGATVTKNGTGTTTLSGANTYTGITAINGGILSISSDANLGAVPASVTANSIALGGGALQATANMILNPNRGITMTANSGLAATSTNALVYAGAITGGFGLTINGASQTGTVSLAVANSYTGGTTVTAGSLGVYNNGSIGAGALTLGNNSTLLLGRAITEVTNNISLTGNATVAFDTNVEYLIVGGGGGGSGGGGGGGGVVSQSASLAGTTYAVVVGAGGTAGSPNNAPKSNGGTGGNSSFNSAIAYGGGGGGQVVTAGQSGASGGGAGQDSGAAASTATQGYAGAAGACACGSTGAGGGGGAGGVGSLGWTVGAYNTAYGLTGQNTMGGNGGIGAANSITGTSTYYGGGGGGGANNNNGSQPVARAGQGGLGGGGTGANADRGNGVAGAANTGGGGGGGDYEGVGAAGGSGVVIVRYLGADAGSGGTETVGTGTATGYSLHTFTGSGTLTLNAIAAKLSGVISGANKLTVNAAPGTLTLSGANTHTGGTTVSGGMLIAGIASTGSAGAVTNGPFGTGTVTVNSGYTVELNGYAIANTFNLSGAGLNSNGALINSTSTALTLPGAITLAADTTISSTGDLTLSGAITSATFGLAFKNGGNYTLSNTSNSLSTIAATGISSLTVTNNSTLTVGTVNTIAGISSAGVISLTSNAIELNGNLTVTTSTTNGVSLLSKTYIKNTGLSSTTINTQGGALIIASNIDDATDGDTTTNGYIMLREGLTVNTRGGDITIGGGDASGTGYALGSSASTLTEGVRIDKVLSLASGGGNISIKGKSYAVSVGAATGGAGFGIYYLNSAGLINSGTGTIYIEGYSQTTNTSTYGSGILFALNSSYATTITSANTTANAIKLVGIATGTSADTWGIEVETNSPLNLYATGVGGGISVLTSQKNTGSNYDAVYRSAVEILANGGDIKLLGGQTLSGSAGIANGIWQIEAAWALGSKTGSSYVASSSSNLTINYDKYYFSGINPTIKTTGTFTWDASGASTTGFGQSVNTGWFAITGISGLSIGSLANTQNIKIGSNLTVNGNVTLLAMGGTSADIYMDDSTGSLTVTGANSTTLIKASEHVYMYSASGGITVNGAGSNTLTIMAGKDIMINQAINGASGKPLTVNLYSDVDNTGGGAILLASTASIATYGGNITLRGGTGDITTGCAAAKTCIAGYASNSGGDWLGWNGAIWVPGYQDNVDGITIVSSGSIDAGAGAITMMGRTSDSGYYGVLIYNGGTTIKAGGDITISGIGASGGSGWGLYLGNGTVWSTGGNISLTGTGSNGMYLGSQTVAAGNSTTFTSMISGGTITINATGNTSGYKGLRQDTSSVVAFGAISVTATAIGEHAFYMHGTGAKMQSASDITISGTQGSWGLTMYDNSFIQSTKANSASTGNISITASGTNGGLYTNTTGGIYATSNTATPTATPTAGGTLSITATGASQQGIYLNGGSLISYGAMTLNGTALTTDNGVRFVGSGQVKAVGDVIINAITGSGNASWSFYQIDSRFTQSTAGNINITATAAVGYGMYISGGGLVAGNDTTTPTAGGSITINSTSTYNAIDGAALRLDGTSTKIIAYGDITVNANGAAAGLSTANQQGHGIILWGGAQVVRSYNGAVSMTGYANHAAGAITDWANISAGITLYCGCVTIQAKGDITLKGVSSSGIGLYLTYATGTGGGITSETGNIVMSGLSNAASYGGAIIRLPITATLGSVTVSALGQNYAYYQDAWYGSVSAGTDVNIIGYATAGHGIYLNIGSITSSNGNVTLSGYTSSATTTDYGIYSISRAVSAVNGSVTFQGSKLDTVTTLANAVSNVVSGSPAPYFAIADSANPASAATTGISWSGTVTANTTSGYISIKAKAPSITGAMTAYGLALLSNNQSYTLNSASNAISSLAANIGTGSLSFTTTNVLNIGTYNGTTGITAASVTLSAGGLTDTSDAGITVTSSSTVAITNASGSYDFSGVIAGPVALTKSGAGTQTLSAANTYTGLTTISGGTLRLGVAGDATNTPLGTTAAGTTISAGGTLDLNGFTLGTVEALTINGYGVGNNGALINSSTTNAATYTGAITVGSASYIGGAGTMTLSGAVGAASYGVAFIGAGSYTATNASNTFSTIATSGIGSLSIKNNQALSIGAVNTITGMTFTGDAMIDNAGTITARGLTIQKNGALDSTLTLKSTARIDFWDSSLVVKSAIGAGKLNIIFWSESDGGNGFGTTLAGTYTTNGGHIWAGGGATSTTWNGLTVGNGAAGAGGGANGNAIDTQGTWTTSGGSIWLAGNVGSGTGYDVAIANGAAQVFNVGSGSITILGDYFYSSTTTITSTGTLTFAPFGNAFTDSAGTARTFTWSGSGTNFAGTGSINAITINSIANLTGLTIGNASSTSNSAVTISNDIGISGPINIYGAAVTLTGGLTTTNATTGNIGITTTGLTGAGAITLATGRALTVTQSGASTYSGAISGTSATVTKLGAGVLTVSGNSSYTGLTTISAGTLKLGASSSGANSPLGTAATGVTVADGAALDLSGYSITTLVPITLSGSGVSGSGALYNSSSTASTYAGAITLAADTTIKSTGALTLNGVIAGAFGLTVTNTGDLTLGSTVGTSSTRLTSLSVSGAANLYGNVWTTGAQIYTGNLGVGGDIGLNSTSGGVTIGGAITGVAGSNFLLYETTTPTRSGNSIVYSVDNSGSLSTPITRITYRMEVTYGGTPYWVQVTFDAWANNLTAADLRIPDVSNNLVLQKIVNNMVVSSNQTAGIASKASGVITGSGFTGYLELWPLNYTQTISNAGGLSSGSSSAYDYNDTPVAGTYGSFQVHNITSGSVQTVLAWNNHGATPDVGMGNYIGTTTGTVGNVDWTFTGQNSVGMGTTAFKMQVSVNGGNPSLNINAGAGAVNITGATSGLRALTVNSAATTSTITGAIANATGYTTTITKQGAGALVLNGANTYAGGTTISAGTVKLGNASSLGDSAGAVSVADGAVLDLNGQTVANTNALTLSGTGISSGGALINSSVTAASYAGTVALAADTSITATGNITLGGVVSGSGALTKLGAGTLVLSGTNTYTASTAISAGILSITTDRSLGAVPSSTTASSITLGGGVLQAAGSFTLSANRGITMTANSGLAATSGNNLIVNGVVDGAYNLTINGASQTGAVTLAGANTYTGATTVSAGTLNITNNGGLGTTANGTTVASGATLDLIGVTVGAEAIALNGGTLADATSSLAGDVTLSANSTISVANAVDTFTMSGVISGAFSITKTGAGTLILTGANTYGATTISAGVLQVGAGGAVGTLGAGNVTNNATLTFNRSDDFSYDKVISGSGALIKNASNTITLTGANTYTGATTINAGQLVIERDTLTFATSGFTGAGTLVVQSAAANFASPYTFNATISNLGGLTIGKTGNATAVTLSGAININGNLLVNAPTTLGANITTGGTQEYTGNVSISASSVSLSTMGNSSTGNSITFGGNLNGTIANGNSLYILSGTGSVNVIGSVGNIYALNYFGLGGTGQYQAGSTTNFAYTGAVQTFTATYAGTYTFYTWGAQGGDSAQANASGGMGGYSYGNYVLSAGQTVSIYVGGTGADSAASGLTTGSAAGGWNGGGTAINSGSGGGGGGGATDIRVGGTALTNRVIVAGGGGGAGYLYTVPTTGGYGGGLTGGAGNAITESNGAGAGGTQSAGGASGAAQSGTLYFAGSLGVGADSNGWSWGGAAGGGGYYGGGSGFHGGGGGSSYIGGVTGGVTIAGNATQTSTGGGTQTGQAGNGYARIVLASFTTFNAGTQTGAVTIGGSVNAANVQTASTNFAVKIGQTVASGTSNI